MEITALQTARLELLQTLNYDTAATKVAVAFIGEDQFKHKLFIQQYNRVYAESDIVARSTKAVQESVEALAVINGEDEK
jgi:hypothetical protein